MANDYFADLTRTKPKKPRRLRPEEDIQRLFFSQVRQYGGDGVLCFAVPNDAASKTERGRKVRTGLVAGVSDVCCVWAGGIAFVEMKAPGNYMTPEQRAFADRMVGFGIPVSVARSWQEAFLALEQAGAPLKRVVRDGRLELVA